ncbi:MAG: HAMP domain-containing histidine kinase [Lachnospiraceae bacterium]|nr:HAMP domain-containing histidine kinase [Lachnospiraceae bacterium]
MIVQLLKKYPYAYDVETEIWIAFNSEELRNSTVAMDDLYEGWDPQKMIGILGMGIILTAWYLMVLVYRLSTTGKRMDEQGQVYIECRWGDGMYLEFWLLCICAVAACIIGGSISVIRYVVQQNVTVEGQPAYIYVLAVLIPLLLSVMVTELLCSMARRIRARMVFRQSFLYRLAFHVLDFCKKSRSAFMQKWNKTREAYYAHAGTLARSVGTVLRENISLLVLAGLVIIGLSIDSSLLMTGAAVGFIVLLILILRNKYRLTLEKEQIVHDIGLIVQGENVQINTGNLMPENKQLADSVNTIGKGIQKAVEQSVRDERLKAELLTNVSHDIKTPLTSIISYVDLLKREDLGGNETAQNYLNILDNKSNKLKQLILDLIEISKINSGSLKYEIGPMKPHELLLQALGEYEDKLKAENLKLVYNNSCQDAVIEADARRLWRVIDNLMSNVCKYSLENTRVYVDVTQQDGQLSVVIKNISAQELNVPVEELTERFVRGDVSRTTEGSGLGLSIARSLVMAQGGTFALSLDGDLFKVTITFPVEEK